MESQIENAIHIAASPSSDQDLESQASTFLSQVRQDPTAWQACLSMFTQDPPRADIIRMVCLDIVNHALSYHNIRPENYTAIRDTLMGYIRTRYTGSQERNDSAAIQNKLTQTITYLFTTMYIMGWESIFQDFRALTRNDATKETGNAPGNILYLRVLGSIHDEIADQLLFRSSHDQKKNTDLRDLIRERDMKAIADYWQLLLSRWQQTELSVVEMCLKNVSRWVSWIEISLIVNESMISRILEIAGQQNIVAVDSPEGRARDAAIDTFTEIVGKKMKSADKIELIRSLQLSDIVNRLIASPALSDLRFTSEYDTDFAETVAKLVNNVVFDIVNALNTGSTDREMSQKAEELLEQFIPYMLRFFTDQYDEVCCTVIPSLSELLTYFRKAVKSKIQLPQLYANFITPILRAVVLKMKYDETSTWGEGDDQTDEAEFQDLRKRLYVLQQTIAAIDESLFLNSLSELIIGTTNSIRNGPESVDWRDIELALHELHLAGDLGLKSGNLYQKGLPYNTASMTIIKIIIEVLSCGTNITLHPHPSVQIGFMDIAVRYHSFFDKQPEFIPQVLDAFVTFAHSGHTKVQYQSWNSLLRFIKSVKSHMAPYSKQAIQALLDLLNISAELKAVDEDDSDSSETRDVRFNSQIYLFEAIGCMISVISDSREQRESIGTVTNLMKPIYVAALGPATERNQHATLQIRYVITAWATLAKGLSDWTPNSSVTPPSEELALAFVEAMECTIGALETPQLNEQEDIRNAARFAFPRLLGVLGSRMLPQLPRWIEGLLSNNSTRDEMSSFLRILEQVVFGFKGEISVIMDRFLQPLLERLLGVINMPIEGTDDNVFVAELRREYLNFILIMLSNGLESVFTSDANMPIFETIIQSIENLARDASDLPTARLAFGVLSRMTAVWGGPDVYSLRSTPNSNTAQNNIKASSSRFPDWDVTAMARFTPLSWALLTSPKFDAKDAQARQVLLEIASMQLQILRKTGHPYLEALKAQLMGLGVEERTTEEYVRAMTERDEKGFRTFFVQLFVRNDIS